MKKTWLCSRLRSGKGHVCSDGSSASKEGYGGSQEMRNKWAGVREVSGQERVIRRVFLGRLFSSES